MTHITITLALCNRYSSPFKSRMVSQNSVNLFQNIRHPLLINSHMTRSLCILDPILLLLQTPLPLSIHNPKSYFLLEFALHCTTSSTRQYNVDTPRLNQTKSPSVLPPMPSVLQTTTTLVAYSNYPFPLGFIHSFFPS